MALAPAYFPTQLPRQYRRRWGVSLPCSGWERVGPPRSRHQGHTVARVTPEGCCRYRGMLVSQCEGSRRSGHGGRAASRSALGTARLHALLRLDVRPIDHIVCVGPYSVDQKGGPILGRASRLDAVSAYHGRTTATRRCSWQNNRSTGGPSAPVLSYWGRAPAVPRRPRRIETELSHDVLNPARVPL